MLRGIYTATSGMLTAQRDINVRSNNLANLSTAGFKSDTLVTTTFAEALAIRQQPRTVGRHVDLTGMEEPRDAAWRAGGAEDGFFGDEIETALNRITLSRGRTALEIMTDFSQGALQLTERALDFAIMGDGFFIVASSRGEVDEDNPFGVNGGVYFTRNGQFQIDEEGYLINGRGDFVLDDMGDQINVGTDNFQVTDTGHIIVDGEAIARFGIFNPVNPHLLIKNGEDIFTMLIMDGELLPIDLMEIMEDFGAEDGFTGVIRQHFIERANTDVAREMAGMMQASRSFQSMAQVLRAIDGVLARGISELGRM